MTKREKEIDELMERLKRADTDTLFWIHRLLLLFSYSSGFKAAFDEATPSGEEQPPVDVVKALVKEWAEKEGLG